MLIVITLMILPPAVRASGDPPTLMHNPFSRPPSEVTIDRRRAASQEADPDSPPTLHATMVSKVTRLANVDGIILKPGDEIQGYTLTEIHEQYAIFRRGGVAMVVYVKPHLEDDNE